MLAADPQDFAVDGDELEAQKIVRREAVFEAVHAAGILGDVAADRAGDLRGRIGGVVEAEMLHGMGDAEVGDARLHAGASVYDVDLEDPVEFSEPENDAVGERQGPAGK